MPRTPASEVAERLRVAEAAAQIGLVVTEHADLEVRGPRLHGWPDAELVGGAKAEPRVVLGVAEQRDEWFVEGVSGSEHCVHES